MNLNAKNFILNTIISNWDTCVTKDHVIKGMIGSAEAQQFAQAFKEVILSLPLEDLPFQYRPGVPEHGIPAAIHIPLWPFFASMELLDESELLAMVREPLPSPTQKLYVFP